MGTTDFAALFAETEQKYGLPSGYLSRTAQIESGMNPNAKNPKSSAGGLFQFIDDTAASYGLADKFDPYAATDAAGRLGRDNMATLAKTLGRNPTGAELYLAHQQGGAGAAKLLSDPSAIVGGDEIDLNGGTSGQTAGAFARQWLDKFDQGAGGDYVDVQERTDPNAVTWDETTYVGVRNPAGPDVYAQQEAEDGAPNPYDSWWGEVGAGMASSSWTAHMMRWAGEEADDPFYTPGQMFNPENLKQYPEQYHDMLLDATSMNNAKDRLRWVEEDMVRRERLQAGGGSAIAAELVSGILDPVPLVAGVLTGGIGTFARAGLATRAAAGAVSGAVTNAGMDLIAQEAFDDPYADPVMAGLVGAALGSVGGALSRNRATAVEADMAFEAASRAARGKLAASTSPEALVPTIDTNTGSMGAAQNPQVIRPLIGNEAGYLSEMRDEDVPYGFGAKSGLDFGVSGQMIGSDNPFARLSGLHLFEPAAGTKGHTVTPDSVNTVQRATDRQSFGNFMVEYHPSRMAYLKDQGIFRMNAWARARASKDFSIKVGQYVENPEAFPDANPHVVRAAKAFSDGMANWNRTLRETGLADIPENRTYVPKVASHEVIADVDMRFNEDAIHRWIGEAILAHTGDLDAKIVARMSKGYWKVLRRAAYGMGDDFDRTIQQGDFDGFKRTMLDNLDAEDALGEDEIKAAFDAFTGALDATKKPTAGEASRGVARLKKRTLLDYNKKFNVVDRDGVPRSMSVRDLFENDAEMLFRRYSRSMSGRVAFAKMQITNPSKMEVMIDGIRSEADLQKWKDMMIESYRQTGKPKGEWEAEANNMIENLDFAWKRINGIPVWNNQAGYARWARRIKDMQFIRLMSNMGLNQVQESWKIMSMVGFRASLSQVPAIKTMVKAMRTGEIKGDQLLEELTSVTGLGLDGLHTRLDLKIEDDRIGSHAVGRVERGIDNALDAGTEFTSTISVMKATHDYQQRWAMKAITQRLVDMGRRTKAGDDFDLSKISTADRNRLASMGLGDEDAKLLFRNLLDNAEFDGKRIVGVNVPAWDPQAVTKFRHFVGRYTDRLVQQNDYGALAKWMSHPVLSMFTQFRSFVFGAWAKSTLYSANHGKFGLTDPRMMTLLLGEMMAGTATYMVRQAGGLSTEEGRDKFLDETMDPLNLAKNGWARTATASVMPMLIDMLLVGGEKLDLGVTPQFGSARSSGSATAAFFGSPGVDQVDSALKGLRGIKQAWSDDEEMSQSEIKSLLRALPIPTNYVPFTAALGALIQDRPEK